MNLLIKNQYEIIRELLDSASSVGIIISQDQNIDTIAAGVGLYLGFVSSGRDVQIVSKKLPTVDFSSLFGVDKIKNSFEGVVNTLTIQVPYREGEIEKVSYNIEQDRLNVNLFAENSGITFKESDIKYIKKGSSPLLIITVGVSDMAELESFVDPQSVRTIHIDRNPINSLVGDVALIDPYASSISEIAASLAMALSLGHDVDAYQNFMDGITYATRNFTLSTTSPFAFEAAGFLLQNGARRKEKHERQNAPRDVRARTFPKEDLFLKVNTGGQQTRQGQITGQGIKKVQAQPQGQSQQNISNVDPSDDLSQNMEAQDLTKASGEGETEPSGVPDDWFLPKVFKGSRKGN